jgi:two-component system LytT family sensor kinase
MTLERPSDARRSRDRLLWTVVAVSAALIVLTLIASRFVAPPIGAPAGVRLLPRVGTPPATAGELFRTLGIGSLIWYACFLSAPLFVWLARRFPFEADHRAMSVAVHVAVIFLLAALTAVLQFKLTYRGISYAPPLGAFVRISIITGVLPFITVALAAHALDARSRAQERSLETERVRSQLAESRLEALTAQLQPHFLFNTLQGISTLIARDPVAADRMLTSLSDLLREVLRRSDRREIELSEELRILESYLDISRARFGDRLSIDVDVADATGRALVPFFILQPLVENAIHHGISSHAGAGHVEIGARRDHDRLVLTVTDDGPGIVTTDAQRGIGLANTKARLEELYGSAQRLELGRPDRGGFRVLVSIPFRERATVAPDVREG